MESNPSKAKIFLMMLLSIGFVILGIFIIGLNGLMPKIIGLTCILFFGIGSIALGWQLTKTNKVIPVAINIKEPQSILVKNNNNHDEEVLEEWCRACKLSDKELQAVSAIKWDQTPFPWAVDFGAAAFIREEPYAGILADALTKALKQLPGVKNVIREDTEKWLVDGDAEGEMLVRAGAVAVDKFLHQYRDKWLAEC